MAGIYIDEGQRIAAQVVVPDYKSKLIMGEATLVVMSDKKMPNLWRRFWYWWLLGWTWEAL